MADAKPMPAPEGATGVLVLADGSVIWGRGFGAEGEAVGEVCFNTAMTGYQEIMTDPSYAAQIVTFTFPHIGNVGANYEDRRGGQSVRARLHRARGRDRAEQFPRASGFAEWMRANGRIGLSGVDTRALTRRIRTGGAPNGVIAYRADGKFDVRRCSTRRGRGRGWRGWTSPRRCRCRQMYAGRAASGGWAAAMASASRTRARPHVVAIDYGSKHNIFRNLVKAGARVTVLPATASFDEVMAHKPDGFFLSNGPGDPAATGEYAVPVIQAMLETGKPLFGICLGHQLLGLAVGAQTTKMYQGHRGANHPVKRLADGRSRSPA